MLASPITAADLPKGRPGYKLGDWIVTRVGGSTPGRSELVVQAAFLSRYTPANEAARRLLRRLAQTPGFLEPELLDPGR